MTSIIPLEVTDHRRWHTMHVLLDDDRGRLTLRRLWPWQRVLVQGAAARLDRALADGARPETSASLAARATRLTSTEFRRDLAASLRRARGEQHSCSRSVGPH